MINHTKFGDDRSREYRVTEGRILACSRNGLSLITIILYFYMGITCDIQHLIALFTVSQCHS